MRVVTRIVAFVPIFVQFSFFLSFFCLFNFLAHMHTRDLFAFYIQQYATGNLRTEILDRNKIQEGKIEKEKERQTTIITIRRNEAALHSIETHWKLNLYLQARTHNIRNMIRWNGMEEKKKSVQTNAFVHMSEILSFIYMHASYMYNRLNSSRMRIHVLRIYGHVRVWKIKYQRARGSKKGKCTATKQQNVVCLQPNIK